MAYERLRDVYRYLIGIKNMHRNADGSMPNTPTDFRVDRATPLGNPFPMSRQALNSEAMTGAVSDNRLAVLNQYKDWFDALEEGSPQEDYLYKIYDALVKHGHVDLWDWCAPFPCHAETIGNALGDKYVQQLFENPESGNGVLPFRGSTSFLSNMFPAQVRLGKAMYNSAEGAFQAGKLRLPGIPQDLRRELLPQFMSADPYKARQLGRYALDLTPEQLEIWNGGADNIGDPDSGKFGRMFAVLNAKFSDPDLLNMLEGTGDQYLQEDTNILPWGGDSNALGRMLMAIRALHKK